MFNEIQVGRFNRFVQKLLDIKGGPPMPTVASDLMSVLPHFSATENLNLQGWDIFFAQINVTAAAGQKQIFELRNPPASNVIAVVERAYEFNASATGDTLQLVWIRPTTQTDQPTVFTPTSMDSRGRPQSTVVASHDNGGSLAAIAGTGFNYQQLNVTTGPTGGDFLRQGEEIVMTPGTAVYMVNTNVATAVNFMFRWRERFLEDSERS